MKKMLLLVGIIYISGCSERCSNISTEQMDSHVKTFCELKLECDLNKTLSEYKKMPKWYQEHFLKIEKLSCDADKLISEYLTRRK